jgi:hypothetical protein
LGANEDPIPNVKLSASDEELELRNHVAEEEEKILVY